MKATTTMNSPLLLVLLSLFLWMGVIVSLVSSEETTPLSGAVSFEDDDSPDSDTTASDSATVSATTIESNSLESTVITFPSVLPPIKRSFVGALMHETFHVLEECVDTQNEYTLLQVVAPPNTTTVPSHHHEGYDEYIKVLEGVFHTTIGGVNRSFTEGESFVFPREVSHVWWTGPTDDDADTTTILLKLQPCHDGFHESIEMHANMPVGWKQHDGLVKDFFTTAVLYNLGGTIIEGGPWYEQLLLWIFRRLAQTNKGQRMRDDLRQQFLYHQSSSETETTTGGEGEINNIFHDSKKEEL
ncbi:cupin domain containing protein [Nitzschia inconspicua]|uniref:Cupin domain containing protein n=1 Tax=Nitzschia inconspicua TaxID=303405 RepID=A0A9K3KY22_9STRA|nr:cupin domain containing protein [Nitzschia inconspicua]